MILAKWCRLNWRPPHKAGTTHLLEAGEDIVITRNGKPFALMVCNEPAAVESQLRALRWDRFDRLLAKQRARG